MRRYPNLTWRQSGSIRTDAASMCVAKNSTTGLCFTLFVVNVTSFVGVSGTSRAYCILSSSYCSWQTCAGSFQHHGQLSLRNPFVWLGSPQTNAKRLFSAANSQEDRRWVAFHSPVHIFLRLRWRFLFFLLFWGLVKSYQLCKWQKRKANCHLNICRQILSLLECTLGG